MVDRNRDLAQYNQYAGPATQDMMRYIDSMIGDRITPAARAIRRRANLNARITSYGVETTVGEEQHVEIPLAAGATSVRRTAATVAPGIIDAVLKIADFEEDSGCSICTNSVWNTTWVIFPCKHYFCLACVFNLINSISPDDNEANTRTKRSCPLCRRLEVLGTFASFEVCYLSSMNDFELTIQTTHTNELFSNAVFEFTGQADKFKLRDLTSRFPRLPAALESIEDLSYLPRAKRLKLTTVTNTKDLLTRELNKAVRDLAAEDENIKTCEAKVKELVAKIDDSKSQKAALEEHILDLKTSIAAQAEQIKSIKQPPDAFRSGEKQKDDDDD